MSKVLVIGCGGVAGVAISKCCQVSEVFTELCIASRTKNKCMHLPQSLRPSPKQKSPRHRSMQTTCSSFVTLFKATSRISS